MALLDAVARGALGLGLLALALVSGGGPRLLSQSPLAGRVRAEDVRAPLTVELASGRVFPEEMRLAADLDDDDEDGVIDGEQARPPSEDLVRLHVEGADSFVVAVTPPLALIADGVRVAGAVTVKHGRPDVSLQVTRLPAAGERAQLRVSAGERSFEKDVRVAALRFLDFKNQPVDPTHTALGISHRITHDRSLPREQSEQVTSVDPENVRLELDDASVKEDVLFARVEARSFARTRLRALRHVTLRRVPGTTRFRSAFVRLVSDATDASAPDVADQLLRVELRDEVRAVVVRGRSELSSSLRVGRPGRAGGPRSVLQGTLRLTVLRSVPGGPPVLGDQESDAKELARSQIEIANEIWAQCFVTFGDPQAAEVRVVDAPPPALLAISDIEGLPARGDGNIVFRAAGKRIGPIATHALATPEQTALEIARVLAKNGLSGEVTVNPRTEMGAGMGADVVVRNARGELVTLSVDPAAELSTDAQQRVAIGHVELSDGIQEFDNALAAAGTLEERTLIKLLSDRDPTTIEVILINHFVNRDRQGEAFIEADGSSMANVLVFDRNAVRYDRQAWVQAHELGHVLLDEAFHPDSVGPDRPWLLMDSDARQGRVTGPKRLRDEDCARVRRRSGPDAHPALLRPAP